MPQKYTIYIDSCAWNTFLEQNLNLLQELPKADFEVRMPKQVNSFEIPAIPARKEELKKYIQNQITLRDIEEFSFFGFSSYHDDPSYRPRIGGFGVGRFASIEQLQFMKLFEVAKEKPKKSGLFPNEADASLAVMACTGGIVLTKDCSSGPLKKALDMGGKVINIGAFNRQTESLKDFIFRALAELPKGQRVFPDR